MVCTTKDAPGLSASGFTQPRLRKTMIQNSVALDDLSGRGSRFDFALQKISNIEQHNAASLNV